MFAKGAPGNFFFENLCLFRGNKAGDMTTTTQLGVSSGG